jgi:hypothetical protein
MQLTLLTLKDAGRAGIGTMAAGLAALQPCARGSNKDEWLASPFNFDLAIVAWVFLSASS